MAENKRNYGRSGSCGCGNRTYSNIRAQNMRQSGDGCGCSQNNARMGYDRRDNGTRSRAGEQGTCCEAREQLKKLEFSIMDTVLYLDAYPDSDCALAYYHKLLEERDCLRKKIAEECGPTNIYENVSTTSWDWVEGPWPWQVDAN